MFRKRWILVFVLACILPLVWLFHGSVLHTGESNLREEASSRLDDDPSPDGERMLIRSKSAEALEATVDKNSSTHGQRIATGHRVVDSNGMPIVGAVLSWTPLVEEWLEPSFGSRTMVWEKIDQETVLALSDEEGSFSFDTAADSPAPLGSVIWVTHHDYLPECVLLGPDADLWSIPNDILLRESPGISVEVRCSDSSSPLGTVLIQTQGNTPAELANYSAELRTARRILLRRTTILDSSGRAGLCPFPEMQAVRAIRGDMQSETWLGRHPAAVVLTLGPTFSASGVVMLQSTADRGTARVVGGPRVADLTINYDACTANSDGHWGPMVLPLVPADEFVFRCEGGDLVPQEVGIDPPGPNERVRVDFQPQAGLSVSVRVVDLAQAPIAAAEVTTYWMHDRRWCIATIASDEQGVARFAACPLGEIWISGSRSRYVSKTLGPLDLSSSLQQPVLLELSRAGVILGTCLHDGEPLEDFELIYWQDDLTQRNIESVRGSKDGRFEIDEAPLGTTVLLAYTDELPESEPVILTVEPDKPVETTLHLAAPLFGHGRIVDARTNEPVTSAVVQAKISHGNVFLGPRGPEISVDSDGRFEGTRFLQGENTVFVSAPGYSSATPRAFSSVDGQVDFGVVGLQQLQDLEIHLVIEGEGDPQGARASLQGKDYRPLQAFDANGITRFPGVGPGDYDLTVTLANGPITHVTLDLQAGRTWVFDIPVLQGPRLVVEVVPSPGKTIPEASDLRVAYSRPDGTKANYYAGIPANGLVEVRCDLTNEVTLEVYNAQGTLAIKRVALDRIQSPVVQIELEDSVGVIQVVDSASTPLSGVAVSLTLQNDESGWIRSQTTGSDGLARFRGIRQDRLWAHLIHPVHGIRAAVPIDFDASDQPVVVELDARFKISIRLVDGSIPLPGVPVHLEPVGATGFQFANTYTDGSGLMIHDLVADGAYIATVVHPGIWLARCQVQATRHDTPTTIQVRRLGSAEVAVERGGVPAAGILVDMHSTEFDADVSEWISGGIASARPSDRYTGADGKIRFDGIPHGEYVWRVALPNGEWLQGTVAAPASGVASVPVKFP